MCQTIFAHYLLHLHDLDVGDKEKLEEVYANITESAIHNGMLEDSLDKVDPDSDYIVEAAGPRVPPTVHKHHPFHERRLTCRRRLLQGSYTGDSLAVHYKDWLDKRIPALDKSSPSNKKSDGLKSGTTMKALVVGVTIAISLSQACE